MSQASAGEPRCENAHICQNATHAVGVTASLRQPPAIDATIPSPLPMATYSQIAQNMELIIASGLTISVEIPANHHSHGPVDATNNTTALCGTYFWTTSITSVPAFNDVTRAMVELAAIRHAHPHDYIRVSAFHPTHG